MKKYNFSAGPAIIPESVLEEASISLKSYKNTGLSVAEISHRSPIFLNIIEEATQLVKDIYAINDDYDVLWLSGGASTQMTLAPMNLLNTHDSMAIVDTGFWAQKAIEAASEITKVHILASSKSTNYDRIPKDFQLPHDAKYLHVVSNETIDGTQHHTYPDVPIPLVADMTSDFLSRPIDLKKFGIIFASAQKNFGMAGITCVIIRKDMAEIQTDRKIPSIFNYKTHISSKSLYHTCPTFPIYTSLLMLRWIKTQGGLKFMQQTNTQKAQMLYAEIDRNPLFEGNVVTEDRSIMNVCFKAKSEEIEKQFLDFAESNNIVGIKGFPTVGGFRASIYNGMPLETVEFLAEALKEFRFNYDLYGNSRKASFKRKPSVSHS